MHQRRLDSIDTLRGIAAIGVVVYHLRLIASGAPLTTPVWMASIANHVCEAGVPLFFAISGFLLTMLMPSYERHSNPKLSFYAKRFFRIAPLFYATILLWTTWSKVLPPTGPLLANVSFTFNLIPGLADSVIFAGWTIGVEMLFYALFPILYPRLPGITLKVAATVGSLLVASLGDSLIVNSGLPPRYALLSLSHSLPMFIMGMLVFDLSRHLQEHQNRSRIAVLLLACSAFTFELILNGTTVIVPERYWQGLACGLLLLAFSVRPFAIVNPVTAFFGRISYSMYLLHGLIIILMGHAFLAPYRWGLPPALAFPVSAVLALLVIVPISWVTFEVVETPGNWLGRKVVDWLDRPRQGALPAGEVS